MSICVHLFILFVRIIIILLKYRKFLNEGGVPARRYIVYLAIALLKVEIRRACSDYNTLNSEIIIIRIIPQRKWL